MKEDLFKTKKKKKLVVIIGLVAITIVATGAVLGNETKRKENVVYDGVYLENKDLGGLNKEELIKVLQEHYYEKLKANTINLLYKDVNEEVTAVDVGFSYNIDEMAEEIMGIGKEGNLLKNTIDRIYIKLNKETISFNDYNSEDEAVFNEYIDTLASSIDKEKQNPRVSFSGDEITVESSESGYVVDKDKLKEIIIENLENEEVGENIDIPVSVVEVDLHEDYIKNMTILGTYETDLPDLTSGRTENIRLFSSKLNGVVLMPGETISVDEQGGSRELSDGYTAAPGFINNEVVNIVAGGICQVVTTLYNSVLYSDLEIVERAPHSLPVTYVPLGRDATLAKGVVDFKFKNNYENPIVIQAYVTDNCTIKTTIWGIDENPNKTIEIDAVQTSGKSSITYKRIYEKGELVKSEVLSQDVYN